MVLLLFELFTRVEHGRHVAFGDHADAAAANLAVGASFKLLVVAEVEFKEPGGSSVLDKVFLRNTLPFFVEFLAMFFD